MGMLKRKREPPGEYIPWPLELLLLALSRFKEDALRLLDFLENFLILGSLGSGKTSGSLRTLVRVMLKAGFSGVIVAASPEDRANIIEWCRETGRLKDLRIFAPDQPWRYNFLAAEIRRHEGHGFTQNVVELLCNIVEATDGYQRQQGDQVFWIAAMKEMLYAVVNLLILSLGRDAVSLSNIRKVVNSAPRSLAQADPDNPIGEAWRKTSFCYECLVHAMARDKTPAEQMDFDQLADYFMTAFPGLGPDTQGSVVLTFSALSAALLQGHLRDLFCMPDEDGDMDIVEFTENGGVLLVDMPVEQFNEVGKYASVLLKTAWQRGMAGRHFRPGMRPKFLVCDEFQHVVSTFDKIFAQASRRHGVSIIAATQSISNLYAQLGGEESRSTVDALCGLMGTKIFHSQGDSVTNSWASQCIGSDEFVIPSYSYDMGGLVDLGTPRRTTSGNRQEREQVRSVDFSTLRKGGKHNNYEVESYVLQVGRVWKHTGRNYIPVIWRQNV